MMIENGFSIKSSKHVKLAVPKYNESDRFVVIKLFYKMVVEINMNVLADLLIYWLFNSVLSITVGANKQVKLRKCLYFQAYV